MKILRLTQSRILLWAHERGSDVPYEVSKVVQQPLQPRCPTAPRCPDEAASSPATLKGKGSLWLDPQERPRGSCAYTFGTRGECLQTRNQLALEAALFKPGEVLLTRRLLEALGFTVEEEAVDTTRDPRILEAHGPIGQRHQVRLLRSPSAGQIVLVRRLPTPAAQRGEPRRGVSKSGLTTPTLTVLPAGSNP